MADYRTRRKCPWCGETVTLSECSVIATNTKATGGAGPTAGVASLGEFDDEPTYSQTVSDLQTGPVPVSGADVLGYAGGYPIIARSPASQADSGLRKALAAGGLSTLPPLGRVADQADLPSRQCPKCLSPLPAAIDDLPLQILGIVGLNRAGKTYFMAAALAGALYHSRLEVAGIGHFSADEDTSSLFRKEYFNRAFRKQERLQASFERTDDSAPMYRPLLFEVEDPFGRRHLIAMHDVSGEVISNQQKRSRFLPFMPHIDGLLFVVDPLEIEAIRNRVPPEQVTDDFKDWDQVSVLKACIDALGTKAMQVPVNVVLTKSDLVTYAADRRLTFSEELSNGSDWTADQRDVDREVRALLVEFGEPRLEREAAFAASGNFHAVSPLGQMPADPKTPVIETPLRCEDALATLLLRMFEPRRQ